jgi:hypothetical protein
VKAVKWIGRAFTLGKVFIAFASLVPLGISYKLGYQNGKESVLPSIQTQLQHIDRLREAKDEAEAGRREEEKAKDMALDNLRKAGERYEILRKKLPPEVVCTVLNESVWDNGVCKLRR